MSDALKSSSPAYMKKQQGQRLLVETQSARAETVNPVPRFGLGENDVRTGKKVVLDVYQAERSESGHVSFLF